MPFVRSHETEQIMHAINNNPLNNVENQVITQEIHSDGKKKKETYVFFRKKVGKDGDEIKLPEEGTIFIVCKEVERSSNFTISIFQRY